MDSAGTKSLPAARQRRAARPPQGEHVLRLYVAGMTPRSLKAVEVIRGICETHLQGRYDLQIIDLFKRPALAKGDQILATPTLIRKLPRPLRRFIGDLSNLERILVGLDLRATGARSGRVAADGNREDSRRS